MTKEEALAYLTPIRTYTVAEHTEAWYRFCLEQIHDKLFDTYYYSEYLKPGELRYIDPKEAILKLHKMIYPQDSEGNDIDDWWVPAAQFNSYWTPENLRRDAEGEMHAGDCTSCPWTCDRCYVDQFYRVDTRVWRTDAWKDTGKLSGNQLWSLATRT